MRWYQSHIWLIDSEWGPKKHIQKRLICFKYPILQFEIFLPNLIHQSFSKVIGHQDCNINQPLKRLKSRRFRNMVFCFAVMHQHMFTAGVPSRKRRSRQVIPVYLMTIPNNKKKEIAMKAVTCEPGLTGKKPTGLVFEIPGLECSRWRK